MILMSTVVDQFLNARFFPGLDGLMETAYPFIFNGLQNVTGDFGSLSTTCMFYFVIMFTYEMTWGGGY